MLLMYLIIELVVLDLTCWHFGLLDDNSPTVSKQDKPNIKKIPVGADVGKIVCILNQMGYSTTNDAVLGDWALIAFYYLLHMGEYNKQSTRNETQQTSEFRMMGLISFNFDENIQLHHMPRGIRQKHPKGTVCAILC